MQDYLIRGTAMNGQVRLFVVLATQTVGELQRRHGTYPVATAALGRTVSAGLMIGAMLKGEEKLTIQVKGGGPLGQIVVDANAKGEVRGYVDNPDIELPSNALGKIDVAGGVGTDGFIHITKDLGLKEPYRGSTPIVSGELGEDFTYYFASSEQTPSAVGLGVLVETDGSVRAAGGFIIQIMPGMADQELTLLEHRLSQLQSVTSLLESGETLEQLGSRIVDGLIVHEKQDVTFRCTCSRDRVSQTLISLGTAELEQMIEETGEAEVVCHFCNESYQFDAIALQDLIDQINA